MAAILIIDDDECLRVVAADVLRGEGHVVVEACNGKEGLELFRRTRPDLVITDIVMPEKEGLGVLIELRKVRPPVKVIAMSGGGLQSATDYLEAARLLGAARVLAKPFTNAVLIAAVNELLPADPQGTARAKMPG